MTAITQLRSRKEWQFFAALPQGRPRAGRWRGGPCCSCAACCRRSSPSPWACWSARSSAATAWPARSPSVGIVFVLLQVLAPIHTAVSHNLGDRTAAWLYDRLTEACVRPPGMGHLEDPELAADLTVARDFDLGMTGPPLSISMDFIAGGLVEHARRPGLGRRPVRLRVVGAAGAGRRVARHALAAARERGLAGPQHRRGARARSATPSTRTAWPSIRRRQGTAALRARRTGPSSASSRGGRACTSCSTRPRACASGRCCGACCSSAAANVVVFWALASAAADGRLDLGALVVYAQAAVGTSRSRSAGFNWALDGAAAPVAAVLRLEPAMAPRRRARRRHAPAARPARARDALPRRHVRLSRAARRCSTAST